MAVAAPRTRAAGPDCETGPAPGAGDDSTEHSLAADSSWSLGTCFIGSLSWSQLAVLFSWQLARIGCDWLKPVTVTVTLIANACAIRCRSRLGRAWGSCTARLGEAISLHKTNTGLSNVAIGAIPRCGRRRAGK